MVTVRFGVLVVESAPLSRLSVTQRRLSVTRSIGRAAMCRIVERAWTHAKLGDCR